MIEHIGDDAALYALGLLDENERAVWELHAGACIACATLLDQACEDVTGMVEADGVGAPGARAATRTFPWVALAAALLIALLPGSIFYRQNVAMRAAMAQEDAVVARLTSSDHRTAAFGNMSGGSAQVAYGADGSWYAITVKGAPHALQVAWMHDGRRTMLGTTRSLGEVAMLYLPQSHRMDKLALMDGDTVVGEANLAY